MNARERVLRALKVKEGMPDRIPIQFDLCRQLQDHFAAELGLESRYTTHIFEDCTYRISGNEIRLAMGGDVLLVGPEESKHFVRDIQEDGSWRNEYEMKLKQGDIYVETIEFPLSNISTVEELDAFQFPDPHDPTRFTDAQYYIEKYKEDYVIIGDIEVTVLSLAQQLVGMEKLMVDMAFQKEYVVPLFQKCADFQTQLGIELIQRGVDAIWVGDDFGGQTNLLFSPAMFCSMLKPIYKKMVDDFKAVNPNIIAMLHCDGAVKRLLQDIKDIGFHVFNPVQPGVPGHLPQDLKDEFGDIFAFWGALDQQYLLPNGTDAEVEETIQEICAILGKNRGYMISPAHIIQADVSPQRVKFFIEMAKKYGNY